jgi:fructose-bisphosphate aldolase class II
MSTSKAMINAFNSGIVIPAFNIFYLPAIKPIVQAIKDTQIFGMVEVARLEWTKFKVENLESVYNEFQTVAKNENCVKLHLDHIPVVDEDGKRVDYIKIIEEALQLGYHSVMVDSSRLSLKENISAVKKVVELAHSYNVPVEAELGAVMGHEEKELPPYEELFSTKQGFTSVEEAAIFVKETNVDWLSIAAGSVHGAVSVTLRDLEKVEARLDIDHIKRLRNATNVPLVLHGGTGIKKEYIKEGINAGISKINIATAVRKAYEKFQDTSIIKAQEEVYKTVKDIIINDLEIEGTKKIVQKNIF